MSSFGDVLTRTAAAPELALRYGPNADHLVDAWLPAGRERASLVTVVHGGFWRGAYDRTHAAPQCSALADAGYAVAAIEYRRTGAGGGWPGTFDDIALAVDAVPGLVSAAAPGRVDGGRLVLVGHSAGGHLALWAAARHRLPRSSPWHRRRPAAELRGVVSLAGVCDLAACFVGGLGGGAVTDLLGGGPADVPERYAAADARALVPTGLPVTLVHGSQDDVVPASLSRDYAAVARAVGDPVDLVVLEGADHFDLIDPESAAWPHVLAAVRGRIDS